MRNVSILCVAVLLSGCGGTSVVPSPNHLTVAATIYPLAYLAQRIGGEDVPVTLLTPPGAEPHDVEPTPQTVESAVTATLLIINGAGIDAWAERVDRGAGATLIMTNAVAFSPLNGGEGGIPDPQANRNTASLDPHAWLDPVVLQDMARAISTQLSTLDPTRAQRFQENTNALLQDLQQVDHAYQTGLAQCRMRTGVVSHDAFGYLARRYQLHLLAIAGLSPDAEPSPAQLGRIAELAQQAGVKTIFTESLASPKLADTLAQELHLTTTVLNPIEGLTTQDRAENQDLLSLMRRNLQNLRVALQCS